MPHFFCVLPVSYHGGRQSGSSIWFISIYSKVFPFLHFHEMAVLLFGNSRTSARSPVTAADRRFSVAYFSKVCPPALPGRVNKFSLQVSSEAKGQHGLAASPLCCRSPAASGGASVPHQLGSLQKRHHGRWAIRRPAAAAGSDGCVPPAAPARAAPGSRTVALQPQARDPFSNLVAGTGGAAARDM